MEYFSNADNSEAHTEQKILCCECATPIAPNAANMCVACLRTKVDITEGIPKQSTLYFCRFCERYLQPPSAWVVAELESRALLAICLKRIKGLSKVRLIDAGFIWTEPHSKRVKVKLVIQKEVMQGAVLQQQFVVEFVVTHQMCEECQRVEAKDYWRAMVQIRQKTTHKKTLLYLEQLILKYNAHANTTNIKVEGYGMDFYYGHKQDARKLVEFLQTVVPCKFKLAEELISHDIKSNIFNYKFTYCVDIVPICKDSIVCLPKHLAQKLGNLSQICVCLRVTNAIHLIDPQTLFMAELSGEAYWRNPFDSICGPKQLAEFTVMDVDYVREHEKPHVSGHGNISKKHVLADVWVVKSSELGVTDRQLHCRSFLGHLLHPGDSVLGFDFTTANVNETNLNKMKVDSVPDVLLVKKIHGCSAVRSKKRKWKLQHLPDNPVDDGRDYNDFLEELEEDPTVRQNINIYKKAKDIPVETDTTDDEDFPRISLEEMLDDLHIGEDATGGEGAEMTE